MTLPDRLHVLVLVGPPPTTAAFDRLTAAVEQHGYELTNAMSQPLPEYGGSKGSDGRAARTGTG